MYVDVLLTVVGFYQTRIFPRVVVVVVVVVRIPSDSSTPFPANHTKGMYCENAPSFGEYEIFEMILLRMKNAVEREKENERKLYTECICHTTMEMGFTYYRN